MPTTSLTQDLLWYSNPIILFLCAYGLYYRNRRREFRFFFAYLLFVGLTSFAMKLVSTRWGINSDPYFYIWIIKTVISIGLSFAVLYEVVQNVMTSGTLKVNESSFILAASIFMLAGAISSLTFKADNDQAVMKAIFIGGNVARFDQASLLLLLAALSLFFGFYWGDLAFGISAGFGTYALMEIVRTYLRGRLGPEVNHFTNLVSQWSYQIASLIWLFYIWRKREVAPPTLPSDRVSEFAEPVDQLGRVR